MILETIRVGSLQTNCYILAEADGGQAIIIDPGDDEERIRRRLQKYHLTPGIVVNTHGHYDHIVCDEKFGVPIYVHKKDAPLLKNAELNLSNFLMASFQIKAPLKELEDKELIRFGGITLEVIHTPGHTPGGMCLLLKDPQNKILFSGDSLFFNSVGRTDFAGASGSELIQSIKEKLLILPDDTVIYPGHGPSSSIGEEKKNNPYL